jgi:hypothetical protein
MYKYTSELRADELGIRMITIKNETFEKNIQKIHFWSILPILATIYEVDCLFVCLMGCLKHVTAPSKEYPKLKIFLYHEKRISLAIFFVFLLLLKILSREEKYI